MIYRVYPLLWFAHYSILIGIVESCSDAACTSWNLLQLARRRISSRSCQHIQRRQALLPYGNATCAQAHKTGLCVCAGDRKECSMRCVRYNNFICKKTLNHSAWFVLSSFFILFILLDLHVHVCHRRLMLTFFQYSRVSVINIHSTIFVINLFPIDVQSTSVILPNSPIAWRNLLLHQSDVFNYMYMYTCNSLFVIPPSRTAKFDCHR